MSACVDDSSPLERSTRVELLRVELAWGGIGVGSRGVGGAGVLGGEGEGGNARAEDWRLCFPITGALGCPRAASLHGSW